jgi:Holliday junction resolvase
MPYARKVDVNQAEIVKTLRQAGADVHILSMVGKGMPDLMVCFNGETILMEVKKNAKAKYTPDRVDSPEAALRAIGLIRVNTES